MTTVSHQFDLYKPELFNLSNMVEVQVSFQVVRVGRHDYVFVPKLRAMCLLGREAEAVSASSGLCHWNVDINVNGPPGLQRRCHRSYRQNPSFTSEEDQA